MLKYLPLVMFSQQNHLFAFEASFIRGQGSTTFLDESALLIPFNKLLKPTKTEGEPTALSHWLRLTTSSSLNKTWLLAIEGEAKLIELPVEQVFSLPPLLSAGRTFPALQAVSWYQQQLVSLIDARVLLKLAQPLLAPVMPGAGRVE